MATHTATAMSVPAAEDLGATELIELILATHHAFANDAFGRIGELAPVVVARHGGRDSRLAQLLDDLTLLKDEMLMHMLREERVLFPVIRDIEASPDSGEAEVGAMLGPLVCMKREHGFIDEMFGKCRALTDGYTAPEFADDDYRELLSLIGSLDADTVEHVRKEERLLFARAMELAPPVR